MCCVKYQLKANVLEHILRYVGFYTVCSFPANKSLILSLNGSVRISELCVSQLFNKVHILTVAEVNHNHMFVVQKWQVLFWPTLSVAQRRTPHRLGRGGPPFLSQKTRGIEKE
jgi:hypothetical protein